MAKNIKLEKPLRIVVALINKSLRAGALVVWASTAWSTRMGRPWRNQMSGEAPS